MKRRILPEWNSYRQEVMPKNAAPTQVKETRRGFYAGALAMLSIIKRISDKCSKEQGAQKLDEVQRELNMFNQEDEQNSARGMKSITNTGPQPVEVGTLEIKEYGFGQWCPTPDGTGPPEQLWMHFKISGIDEPFALRFKTRQAWDDFSAIGDGHADQIWPDGDK